MKTTGVTLGITGSFFALYGAIITFQSQAILEYPGLSDFLSGSVFQTIVALRWVLASALFLSLILGAIGSALFCKKGTVSGTLLIAACMLSAVTVCGIVSAVLFALSGIFAFVSDKRTALCPQAAEADSDDYDMGI